MKKLQEAEDRRKQEEALRLQKLQEQVNLNKHLVVECVVYNLITAG